MNEEMNILDELSSDDYLLPDVQVDKDGIASYITMKVTVQREVDEKLFEKINRVIGLIFEFELLEKEKTRNFRKGLYRLFIDEVDWHTFINAIRIVAQIFESSVANRIINANSIVFDTNPKHEYFWTYVSNQLSSAIYFEDIARAKFFADMIHTFYPDVDENEILSYLYHMAKERYWDTDKILSSFIKPNAYKFKTEDYEIIYKSIERKLSIDNIEFMIVNDKKSFNLEDALKCMKCNFEIHVESFYIRKSKTDKTLLFELTNKVAKYVEKHYQELPIDFVIQANLPNLSNQPYWYFIYGIVSDDEDNKAFVVVNSNIPYTKETMESWLK